MTKLYCTTFGLILAAIISFVPPFNIKASQQAITGDMALEQVIRTNSVIDSNNRVLHEEHKHKALAYSTTNIRHWSTRPR